MDSARFDQLTRSVSLVLSRRVLTGALAVTALSGGLAEAKKKHKKRKKKKKVKFNDFGCVNVGSFCKNSGQCCSGICSGKKDKKKCQAHDQGTCQEGQQAGVCGGADVECTTTGNTQGVCLTTTGNGEFCAGFATCFPCKKDADCQDLCGPQAACIDCGICAVEPGNLGTACAALDGDLCAS